jgi:hypothetical protein
MTCEKELLQIEKDLEKLNKQYIFVDNSWYIKFIIDYQFKIYF